MSIVAEPVASAPVNESFAQLRAESEGFEQLLNELFADMETMCRALDEQQQRHELRCKQLEEEKQRIAEALRARETADPQADADSYSKISELEKDRQSLEEELEAVRMRAADLAKTVADQKREMVEERAESTAELRQMRRVLDKQAAWIARQAKQPNETQPTHAHSATVPNGFSAPAQSAANRDPVLGSVLSQFELLRKDLERRRAPPKVGAVKNVTAS